MGSTINLRTRAVNRPPAAAVPWPPELADFLKRNATAIRAKPGQALPLFSGNERTSYFVRSGTLSFQSALPSRRRLIACLLFPGDIFETTSAPALADASLVAMCASEVLRVNLQIMSAMVDAAQSPARTSWHKLQKQVASLLLHNTVIGTLTGEERTAAVLLELGLRLGTPVEGGTAFALPLSRTDIADYLALNPDTLSRFFSRLKALGIIEQQGRTQTKILDWQALRRECPLADAIELLHRKAR